MTKSKIFLADARDAAERICCLLQPAVVRIEVAGSIRRQAALVGDIEIVCRPRLSDGVGISGNISAVEALLLHLLGRGLIREPREFNRFELTDSGRDMVACSRQERARLKQRRILFNEEL